MTKPYHPDHNPTALEPVRSVGDVDRLPWGGNAWWDLPIMAHVDAVVRGDTLPKATRRAICERAGYRMTGEDCTFETMAQFDEYLAEL